MEIDMIRKKLYDKIIDQIYEETSLHVSDIVQIQIENKIADLIFGSVKIKIIKEMRLCEHHTN